MNHLPEQSEQFTIQVKSKLNQESESRQASASILDMLSSAVVLKKYQKKLQRMGSMLHEVADASFWNNNGAVLAILPNEPESLQKMSRYTVGIQPFGLPEVVTLAIRQSTQGP